MPVVSNAENPRKFFSGISKFIKTGYPRKTNSILTVSGGHHWQWCSWQIVSDPALLQRNLHESIQENDRRRFSGEDHRVCSVRFVLV